MVFATEQVPPSRGGCDGGNCGTNILAPRACAGRDLADYQGTNRQALVTASLPDRGFSGKARRIKRAAIVGAALSLSIARLLPGYLIHHTREVMQCQTSVILMHSSMPRKVA